MKQPWRRLLPIGGLSLLAHLLLIVWIGRAAPVTIGTPADAPVAPLALRLQPARPNTAPVPPSPVHTAPAPAPAATAPVTAATAAPLPPAAAVPAPIPPAPAAPDVPARGGEQGWTAPVQMPGRYRSRLPASTKVSYTVVRAGQPAGAAALEWRTDSGAYSLRIDGVMGTIAVKGGAGDAGVAPETVTEQDAAGGTITTTFDQNTIAIGGRDYPNGVGSQDRASLLMQLTGMGLSEPAQISDVIEIYVAGPHEPAVVQLKVVGEEELATPLGALATRHLVQQERAGEARLEVWLAPARGWLPVQLRVTAPDGTVSTQTVTGIDSP